jgi:hypothetical protein
MRGAIDAPFIVKVLNAPPPANRFRNNDELRTDEFKTQIHNVGHSVSSNERIPIARITTNLRKVALS